MQSRQILKKALKVQKVSRLPPKKEILKRLSEDPKVLEDYLLALEFSYEEIYRRNLNLRKENKRLRLKVKNLGEDLKVYTEMSPSVDRI